MSQATPAPEQPPAGSTAPARRDDGLESRAQGALREMLESSWLVTLAALVLALVISGVLIAAADSAVQDAAGYFFARPADFFSAAWDAVWGAYVALFQGAVFDPGAATFARGIRPITETMTWAVPLILAGLGLGIGFRAGMFNIGAQGQIILGAIFAGYIGFAWDLPPVLHLLLAVIGGVIGGGLWAGIAGYLKARTGANEVIVTIMLNNIAIYLVGYLLTTSAFKRGDSNNPVSPPIAENALYPQLLGIDFRRDVPRLEVPVLLVQGEHEADGRAVLAEEWFAGLEAPSKELVTFDRSGHIPHLDEPGRFAELMGELRETTYPAG